jgi:hypothetical protein
VLALAAGMTSLATTADAAFVRQNNSGGWRGGYYDYDYCGPVQLALGLCPGC